MRFRLSLILLLALCLPAHAQLWYWSVTAGSNGTIDPTINWAVGMAPSQVDASARATMAAVAKWRDDSNGKVTLGGTSTAYTATTNQGNQSGGVSSLTPGYRICFSPNVANGATVTLAVDSQTAKPLRKAPGVELTGGELRAGSPYCATYFSSNSGEYVLNEFYLPPSVALASGTTPISGGTNNYCLVDSGPGTLSEVSCPVNVIASMLTNSAISALGMPVNMQLATSVGSSALTISVCTINSGSSTCNNASSSNPILFAFRDATAANGDPVIISLQASLSITIASGSTMGCQNGVACRLWIFAVNNAGTVGLCAYNALSGTNVIGLNEGVLQSSASGTTGGSSAQTLYCNASALSSKAIRYLGYVEITETTAGTWSSNASIVQLFGPGIKKPGDVVQTLYASQSSNMNTTSSSITTTGSNLSLAITPTSAANIIYAIAQTNATWNSTGGGAGIQFVRGSGGTAFGPLVSFQAVSGGGAPQSLQLTLQSFDAPGTTSATTYYVGMKEFGTVTAQFNNNNGGQGTVVLQEIMGALENANDNGEPLRSVG